MDISFSNLALWVFTVWGITAIISLSQIVAPIRNWFWGHPRTAVASIQWVIWKIGKLLTCPMCTSFWVGGVLGYFWQSPTGNLLLDACFGTGAAWTIYLILWATSLRHEDLSGG